MTVRTFCHIVELRTKVVSVSTFLTASLFAVGFLGSVLFVISFYIQTRFFNGRTIVASLPFFLLISMILTVNNSCDRIPDAVAGRKTLSVEVGERWAFHLLAVEFFLAYIASLCLCFIAGLLLTLLVR